MYELQKKFTISCAHRLTDNNLSDEENKKVFGKCNNLPCHGHNYDIILYLKSDKLENGMIKNFYEIKDIFKKYIDDVYDHHMLNETPGFKNKIPTAENMCKIFFYVLKPYIKELYKIKIYETEGAGVVYYE